jgi:hypothetical protein
MFSNDRDVLPEGEPIPAWKVGCLGLIAYKFGCLFLLVVFVLLIILFERLGI